MAVTMVTIVYEDENRETTAYCLKGGNERMASFFLAKAMKGDLSDWEKICSSHSERGGDAEWQMLFLSGLF